MEELSQRLAFRGGTPLSKLYFTPAVRYSEDLDFVQSRPEPIGDTFTRLRRVLDPWLGEPRRQLKEGRVNLVYRFLSEDQPPKPLKLKIEINSREHFTELGYVTRAVALQSRWFSGTAVVTTFELDELLGTKLRALYQRRKGRDLFDLGLALADARPTDARIVRCFERYLREAGLRVSRAEFESNLAAKLKDEMFRADLRGLLRPGVAWDLDAAAQAVRERLLTRLPGATWRPPAEPSRP